MKYAYSCRMEAMNAQWSSRDAAASTQWYRDEQCWNCEDSRGNEEKLSRVRQKRTTRSRRALFSLQKA